MAGFRGYLDFPSDMALDEKICSCGRITRNLTIMPGTSPPGICYSCVCKQVTINLPPQLGVPVGMQGPRLFLRVSD